MSDDLYLKAWIAAANAFKADSIKSLDEGDIAAAAILRERFIPRVTGPHDGLIERLEAEHSRNGGQGSYAWQSRELCGKAAAAIASLQAELNEVRADAARYRWLRDHSCPPHNFYISVPDEFHSVRYAPGEVDAYIDHARAVLGDKQ